MRGRRCLCRLCVPRVRDDGYPDRVAHPACHPTLVRVAVECGLTVAYPGLVCVTEGR